MVSKITKKTPTKSSNQIPKSTHHRSVKSSLKTIYSYHRNLLKIFSSFTLFHNTPKKPKQPYHRLIQLNNTNNIIPPIFPNRKTVFFDLDETLIHSFTGIPPERYDFKISPFIEGKKVNFYILKRPGAQELLYKASLLYEVVIFTAGIKEYASLVLDQLDPKSEMISYRLFRDSCREMELGKFVKDISRFGRDLGKVVIFDDNPASYVLQKENGIQVSPFVDDLCDRELWDVIRFLNFAESFEDMRDAVSLYFVDKGNVDS